jgi:hypothetical protein
MESEEQDQPSPQGNGADSSKNPDGGHPDDLSSLLVHELRSPIEFELGQETRSRQNLPSEERSSIHSFQELFQHRVPPLSLLQMTKDFAKSHIFHPESNLVKEVATTLYYASIALALTRHHTSISQLTGDELLRGLDWCLAQPWMDPQLRLIFSEATDYLRQHPEL